MHVSFMFYTHLKSEKEEKWDFIQVLFVLMGEDSPDACLMLVSTKELPLSKYRINMPPNVRII